jgi:IS605 OrfB family transposase
MKLSYSEKLEIKSSVEKKVLHDLCHISKCIYNCSLFHQRKFYRETGKYLSKKKLYELIRIDYSKLYRKLNSWVAQRVIYKIDLDYKSYFEHLKVKEEGEKINPPYYKKAGLFLVDFANMALVRKGNQLQIPLGNYLKNRYKGMKYLYIDIPKYIQDKKINHISLIPKSYSNFEVKYTYDVEEEILGSESQETLAIDLGVNTLAACVTTLGVAFLISGKWLKSENRFYNKRVGELQSQIESEKHTLKKMKLKYEKYQVTRKRNRRVKDELHKISFNIVKYCLDNDISKIVIGHNLEWKQEVNIGKRNNQNFVQIPHSRLISYIQYKAKKHGVIVEEVKESYTSKTDSLALETIEKHDNYLGKRKKRGLFQSSIGKLINADINGAINILRKCIGDSFLERIISRGGVFLPWYFDVSKRHRIQHAH